MGKKAARRGLGKRTGKAKKKAVKKSTGGRPSKRTAPAGSIPAVGTAPSAPPSPQPPKKALATPSKPPLTRSPLDALRSAPPPPKRLPLAPERTRFDVASEGEKRALVVVDVQVDFCPGGALPVPRGDEVVGVMNTWIERFRSAGERIYVTRESIPPGSKHFRSAGGPWDPHCVADSDGEKLHPGLRVPWDATIVTKGAEGGEDTYSGFLGKTPDGRSFLAELRLRGVTHLFIGGLATDFCVRATALDGLKHGFKVTLIKEGMRAVELKPGDGERALDEMRKAGAKLV
jgi:nicotinamidase/pyrazinamidase